MTLLIRAQRHSSQGEIKMASVNPVFQLQAVTQCVSLGTDCNRDRCFIHTGQIHIVWHKANAQLLNDVSEKKNCHYLQAIRAKQRSTVKLSNFTSRFFVLSLNGSRWPEEAKWQHRLHFPSFTSTIVVRAKKQIILFLCRSAYSVIKVTNV